MLETSAAKGRCSLTWNVIHVQWRTWVVRGKTHLLAELLEALGRGRRGGSGSTVVAVSDDGGKAPRDLGGEGGHEGEKGAEFWWGSGRRYINRL